MYLLKVIESGWDRETFSIPGGTTSEMLFMLSEAGYQPPIPGKGKPRLETVNRQ
jgi:hypothetical protein